VACGTANLLDGAVWHCASAAPGEITDPHQLHDAETEWLPVTVPGTAAGALRDAGRWHYGEDDEHVLDARDWWFRCRFPHPGQDPPWSLVLQGLATLADVWLNGSHVLHSENMFRSHRVGVERLEAENCLVIRCSALLPVLERRHPRPRWKSRLVRHQSLRWYRTTLLGRGPGWSRWAAPVGPWRPVTLEAVNSLGELTELELHATPDPSGSGGTVSLCARLQRLATESGLPEACLRVGAEVSRLNCAQEGDTLVVRGECRLPEIELWWPHSHGPQPLYPVVLEIAGRRQALRRVGFRRVTLDRSGDGFRISVNGLPIFCRGAVWGPVEPVTLAPAGGEITAAVAAARGAGMNMLRVPGYAVYESSEFWNACDELGMMVWQDCMLASVDPPSEPQFLIGLNTELSQVLGALGGRPALTIVCGSSESYQQAAMYGLSRERWESEVLERHIPTLVAQVLPGVPYVPSSPSGGDPPFTPREGVAHYFGVGAYLRDPDDARLAGVRFAAECLSFGTPPERETIDAELGGAAAVGHAAAWKRTVAQDAGTPWDFEDVRDHYVRTLFGQEPLQVRYSDPERAVDLGRAVIAELMTRVLGQWRSTRSGCDGALVLCWRDLWPGAGWGLVDALGRPKAPLYAVSRVFAPTTVVIVDDGLAGLELNVLHDGSEPRELELRLRVFDDAGAEVDSGARQLELTPHSATALWAHALLGGWRDLNDAYRFGPARVDVVAAELVDPHQRVIARSCHLPAGPARPRLPEVGLSASASQDGDGKWSLTVRSERFAQYVALDVPGWRVADSWFHLLPGDPVEVEVEVEVGSAMHPPKGSVRALNSVRAAPIVVEPER
jgi:beta-mannosidase